MVKYFAIWAPYAFAEVDEVAMKAPFSLCIVRHRTMYRTINSSEYTSLIGF